MKMSKKIITRFAPTPSGYLHMGNVWNLLLVEELARSQDGALWLRIDDLDRARYRRAYAEDIFRIADWLGVRFDGGPRHVRDFEANWSQALRMDRYNEALNVLAASGRVFACTCSRRDVAAASNHGEYPGTCLRAGIPLDTPGAAWRFRLEESPETALPPESTHPVVRRRDGRVAYHVATIVDDVDMGMTHIVRGRDLETSTQVQRALAAAMGEAFGSFRQITFLHHALVTTPGGDKLSKSAGNGAESLILAAEPSNGGLSTGYRSAEDVRRAFGAWRDRQPKISPDVGSGPDL